MAKATKKTKKVINPIIAEDIVHLFPKRLLLEEIGTFDEEIHTGVQLEGKGVGDFSDLEVLNTGVQLSEGFGKPYEVKTSGIQLEAIGDFSDIKMAPKVFLEAIA